MEEKKLSSGETRDKLLKEVKQNKSEEYRNGYVDGVLDFFNESKKGDISVRKETAGSIR